MREISNTKEKNLYLETAYQQLLPSRSFSDKNVLNVHTEKDTQSYLDAYYLFPLTEISINSNYDDIPQFINERFQNILSALSHLELSVALIISGRKGRCNVFLGFKGESTEIEPELFESIVNGIMPGKNIKLDSTINISSLVSGFTYGGMVTGVPTVKIEIMQHLFCKFVKDVY